MSKRKIAEAVDDLDDGLEYASDGVSESSHGSHKSDSESEIESELEKQVDKPRVKDKKLKDKKKAKLSEKRKEKMEIDSQIKSRIGISPPPVICDFIVKKIKSCNPDMSSLELSDNKFAHQDVFIDSSGFSYDERKDSNLTGFIKKYCSTQLSAKDRSHPNILILCQSAIRACNVHRALRPSPPQGKDRQKRKKNKTSEIKSIKLIAKNPVKLDQEMIEKSHSSIAVSTPGRIIRLSTKDKVYHMNQLDAIIIDSAYLDTKRTSIWDHPQDLLDCLELAANGNPNLHILLF